jgi:hypothetical protein
LLRDLETFLDLGKETIGISLPRWLNNPSVTLMEHPNVRRTRARKTRTLKASSALSVRSKFGHIWA